MDPGVPRVTYDPARLRELCTRRRIRSIRVFGSVLRADFGPASDLDLLLEFEPGVDPDLFELGGMQQELSALFGRTVDLNTPDMFSPAKLGRVLANSALGYAA
ncbi:MAG: nucleotidyltransferase domain-containing protein [Phycisphaerales bacterium]|nr:nucleotidyltransferase domain-containing protein [Phycisphaerales bacterium]